MPSNRTTRVWVQGYTRKDGVKVRGFYRDLNSPFERKIIAEGVRMLRKLPLPEQRRIVRGFNTIGHKVGKYTSANIGKSQVAISNVAKHQLFAKQYGTAAKLEKIRQGTLKRRK